MGLDKCLMSHIHHSSNIENDFTALKMPCVPPIYPSLFPTEPLATTLPFAFSIVLPFPECHIFGIIQHISFPD